MQKKPKTGPVSLFDTTEIDNPLSSDEHGDTDKKGNDNETDIRLQDPNENEDLHLNNDLEEESSLRSEDDSQLRSRCTKRPNRRQR